MNVPPHNSKGLIYAILVQGCPVHQEQQMPFPALYSYQKKGLLQLTLGNPLLLHWNIQS